MGDLTTKTNGVVDVITTGEKNQKGLIGTIALGVITVGAMAIKALSNKSN